MVSARQSARAARALLDGGCLAEGARLSRSALAEAAPELEPRFRDETTEILEWTPPAMERDVSRADVRRAERALEIVDALDAPIAATRQRRVAQGIGILLAALATAWLLWPAPPIEVTASGSYSALPTHGPRSAIDGDAANNWLLPDRSEGWIELRFLAPRSVAGVEVTNGRNPPFDDRAARSVEVMLIAEDGALLGARTEELTFGEGPRRFEVAADGVERVRVHVRTWHRAGAAIDEVRVLP